MQDSGFQRSSEAEETSSTESQRAGLESRRLRGAVYARVFGDDAEPLRIDRYTVLKRIGQGGMGVVYSAYDTDLDRKVAVKLLHRTDGGDGIEAWQARMRREAQALAQLSHPNVVAVYDVGEFDQQVFLAMEFVDGSTARQWVEKQPRGWREIVDVYLQAGRGLAAAHAADIVHRDFKPDNVLVGGDGRARVADFGLARATRVDAHEPPRDAVDRQPGASGSLRSTLALTPSEGVLGTPAYMPPEQHHGDSADPKVDQFSFCVSLYEALYGERPFGGKTRAELRRATESGAVRPAPRGVRVPNWVRRVLVRGLSPTPADRHASMNDLLAALQRDPARLAGRAVAVGAAAAIAVLSWHALDNRRERAAEKAAYERLQEKQERRQQEQERLAARDRRDALTLREIQDGAASDPTWAVAHLRSLSDRSPAWAGEARTIANDAVARGVARHVLPLEGVMHDHAFVALSPDGRWLVLRPLHVGPARMIDLDDDLKQTELAVTLEPGPVRAAFTPDSMTLALVEQARLHVLDVETGARHGSRAVDPDHVGVAFSPDGARVAVWGQGEDVQLGPAAGGEPLTRLSGHAGGVAEVRLGVGAGGPTVVTVDELRRVRLWHNGSSSAEVVTGVGPVAMARDGRSLVVSRAGDELWRRDLEGGGAERVAGMDAPVQRLALSPDGTRIAVATADGDLTLLDVTGRIERRETVGRVQTLQFMHDGRCVVVRRTSDLLIYDLSSGTSRHLLGHQEVALWSAPSLDRVRTIGFEKTVRTWDVRPAVPLHPPVEGGAEQVRWLPRADGWGVITRAGIPGFLPATGGTEPVMFDRPLGSITTAGVHGDGASLLIGDRDGRVSRWDPASRELTLIGEAGGPVAHVLGLPDGRVVAAAGEGLVVWDGDDRVSAPTPGFFPRLLGAGPGGVRVLGTMADASDTVALRTLGSDEVLSVQAGRDRPSAFNADATVLVIGDYHRIVRLWTAAAGETRELGAHSEQLDWVTISADGGTVVAAGGPGALRIWDVESGAVRTTMAGLSGLAGVQLGGAGEDRIMAAARDGTIRLVPDPAPRDPAALRSWVSGLTDLRPGAGGRGDRVYVGPDPLEVR